MKTTIISGIINAIDRLTNRLVQDSQVVRPSIESIKGNNLGTVSMRGDTVALFVRQQIPFPDQLTLTIRGRVLIGTAITNPPQLSSLRVGIDFVHDNPPVSGQGASSTSVASDGTFELVTQIYFHPKVPRFRFNGIVTVKGAQVPIEEFTLRIENGNLDWFLNLLDEEEKRVASGERLEFVSRIRQQFFFDDANGLFGQVFGRTPPPLYDTEPQATRRLRTAQTFWFNNEWIRIGHVLTGIEGGSKQNPKPKKTTGALVEYH